MRVIVRGLHPEQTRWVTPFPTEFPKFRIEMKDLSKEEYAKIARRYGMTPQKPEARDYETSIAFTRDLFTAQFVSAEGDESFFGEPLNGNKEPYTDSQVEYQGGAGDPERPPCSQCGNVDKAWQSQSLWLYVDRMAKEERAKEIKN